MNEKNQYDLWYEQKKNTIGTYTDEMPQRVSLVQNTEFKSIKNVIIKEALKLNLPENEVKKSKNTGEKPDLKTVGDEYTAKNPFDYEENTAAKPDFDSGSGILYPRYYSNSKRNNAAVSSLNLLRYLCNMIQNQLRFEEKQKTQRVDKKLWQKIQDKKRDQGLKM